MAESSAEKSHEPTPRRRQMARDRGQVVRSQDLVSAAVLLGGLAILMAAGGTLIAGICQLLVSGLGGDASLTSDAPTLISETVAACAPILGPIATILGLVLLVTVAASLLQTGLQFNGQRVLPDLSRIDPFQGVARIFARGNLIRLGFSLLKVAVIGGIGAASLYAQRNEILALGELELADLLGAVWRICLWTCGQMAVALLALAALDYAYQWWTFQESLRMTPAEMREEMRNAQGHPQIAAGRRRMQRQLGAERLAAAVPTASAVIMSGRAVAVAIAYRPATMRAPIVVAKGIGAQAVRIAELAGESAIVTIENVRLAEMLQHVPTGAAVPERLYVELAGLLSELESGHTPHAESARA